MNRPDRRSMGRAGERMTLRVHLNEGPGAFRRYAPRDRLVPGPVLSVDAASEAEALEAAYVIGNGMALDADGRGWPAATRSLSVGDVVLVGDRAHACGAIGWTTVTPDDLAASLDPARAVGDPHRTGV